MNSNEKWLQWAIELQSLAQAGLFYRYFGMEKLPELATEKNTAEQIQMCFEAYEAEHWVTVFD